MSGASMGWVGGVGWVSVPCTVSTLSLSEIARLEESRQLAAVTELAPESRPVRSGGVMCRAGPGNWMNYATGLGMNGPVGIEELHELVAFYEERGIEPRIEVCPFVDESLRAGLEELGFVVRLFELVFVRELEPGVRIEPINAPGPEARIEVLDPSDDAMVRACADVTIPGFLPEGEKVPDDWFEMFVRSVRHPRTRTVLALVGDRVVGTASMELSAPVGALFGAVTTPEMRGKGVQQALIAARLNMLAGHGAKLASIGSRPGVATERNVRRMGFQLAYVKLAMTRPGSGLKPVLG